MLIISDPPSSEVTACIPHVDIRLMGNQPRPLRESRRCTSGYQVANQLGAQPSRTYRLVAPSGADGRGFQTICEPSDESEVYADGLILTEPRSAVFLEHADCPALVISNQKSGNVLLAHAGRPALTPVEGENIVTHALDCIAHDQDLAALSVYIAGSICGYHFLNERDIARDEATRILEEFGPDFFTDPERLAFSPADLICWQLQAAGLCTQQIARDERCTFADTGLTSHRQHYCNDRARNYTNLTVAVTH